MQEYKDRNFYGLWDGGNSPDIVDMAFENCVFDNCSFSMTKNTDQRTSARNIFMKDCAFHACFSGPAILSDISVHNLKTSDLFIIWATLFKRVTLSGTFDRIKINVCPPPPNRSEQYLKPFEKDKRAFYKNIDWALDISKGKFKLLELEGIPARLIKRDPESQIVITRERAKNIVKPGWDRGLTLSETVLPLSIDLFLSSGAEDEVFVAPLAATKSKRDHLLKGLQELRDIGMAEPD